MSEAQLPEIGEKDPYWQQLDEFAQPLLVKYGLEQTLGLFEEWLFIQADAQETIPKYFQRILKLVQFEYDAYEENGDLPFMEAFLFQALRAYLRYRKKDEQLSSEQILSLIQIILSFNDSEDDL